MPLIAEFFCFRKKILEKLVCISNLHCITQLRHLKLPDYQRINQGVFENENGMMIEFNSHIEDLIFDPVTQKYKVGNTRSELKTNLRFKSSRKHAKNQTVSSRMKSPKSKRIGNLIEKKGLHIDYIVK